MIKIEDLKKAGFIDVSPNSNGLAVRRRLQNNLLEFVYYTQDSFLRLQTVGSGFTMPLKGIDSMDRLDAFEYAINGALEKQACPFCDNPYPHISKQGSLSCEECGY